MTVRSLLGWISLALTILICLTDLAIYLATGESFSLAWVYYAGEFPSITFFVGYLVGHLWPVTQRVVIKRG